MASETETSNENEGILEQMLGRLRTIGMSVEEKSDKMQCCHNKAGEGYDEWRPEDVYENGEY